MNTRFLIFCCILLLTSCKKDLLHWQSAVKIDTHTTSSLKRIRFLSDSICIVVGGLEFEKAEVLYSHDGVNSFTLFSFPQIGKAFYGIGVTPSGIINLPTPSDKMLCSHDSGSTWQVRALSEWKFYKDIACNTDTSTIFITTEAQETGSILQYDSNFQLRHYAIYNYGMNTVRMATPLVGYAGGYGAMLKTTNGGQSWSLLNINSDNFTALQCISTTEVWACGSGGGIVHTTDGGNSWQLLRDPNDFTHPRYVLYDILFTDTQNGWAVGENGVVLHSDDAGHHWLEYDRFTAQNLRSIVHTPYGQLLIAGDGGSLYKLTIK